MGGRFLARPLEPRDLHAIFLLGREVFREGNPFFLPWSEENLAGALSLGQDCSLVAARKKEIGGFLIATAEDSPGRRITIWWLGAAGKLQGMEEMLIASLMDGLAKDDPKVEIMFNRTCGELEEIFRKAGFTYTREYIILERKKTWLNP